MICILKTKIQDGYVQMQVHDICVEQEDIWIIFVSLPRIVPYSNDESGSSVDPNFRRRSHRPCIKL